jgi:hypothetical protein
VPGAVAVGAEGQHQRRLQHHRLVEVQAEQVLLARRVGGLDTDTMFRLPLDDDPASAWASTPSIQWRSIGRSV